MILLTSINDIRKYRQLGKQLNTDNFEGRVREIQENELTELLGKALSYDFFNSLESNWTNQAGTFTKNSAYQLTATGIDLTAIILPTYAIRFNNELFAIVTSCTYDGSDTTIVVEGYEIPDTISSIDWKISNIYIKLLNGTTYTQDSHTVKFNGLRPFISWKLLAIFTGDGNVKHSDTGNFSITSANFERPTSAEINAAKSTYLQNSVREENNIIDYLNENSSYFPLWDSKQEENTQDYNFIII